MFSIIKTPIDNIRTEVIKKPVNKTRYIGINGGFYTPSWSPFKDYDEYETCSMTYYNTNGLTDGYNFNGCPDKHRSLPTFVTYYDKDLQKLKQRLYKKLKAWMI